MLAQVKVMLTRLWKNKHEMMFLTEPVDDVLDCGAASLVSLGEDDVPDWSAGLVLSK